jgi:tRNA threonylcarbamoyladenosine biosynthesis protein TsaE
MIELSLPSLEATKKFGRLLSDLLVQSQVIALSGNLGAGKTTLVKAIGEGLGVKELIASPTFTMLNEYHSGRLPLYHFDFYRVMDMAQACESVPLELTALDFDEILEQHGAVVVIEWPEQFLVNGRNYLEDLDRLVVSLYGGNTKEARRLEIDAAGDRSRALLQSIARLPANFK